MNEPEEKGHWRLFLEALGTGDDIKKPLTCKACLKLQARVVHGQQGQALTMVAVSTAPDSAAPVPPASSLGPEVRSRGRPRKDEKPEERWRLGVFIQQHRSLVYRQCAKSWGKEAQYYCKPCDKYIKFGTQTCKRKLDKHERSKIHLKGLKRLALPLPEGGEPDQDDEAESDELDEQSIAGLAGQQLVQSCPAEEYRCSGVPSDDPTLPLYDLQASITNFVHAGMPRTVYAPEECDPLEDAIFACDVRVSVRSKKCKGPCPRVEKACSACVDLCRNKKFRRCIADKSYLIDLARYGHKIFHDTQNEVDKLIEEIQARDYRKMALAGADFEALIALPSKLSQVTKIRNRLDHTPAWRFSPAMKEFKQNWLPKTDLYHNSDVQAQAHASLVASLGQGVAEGKVRQLDLQLASQIAAGQLRCDALVDGLLTTFLRTLESSQRNTRRHRSGEWIDEHALMDAVQTLGGGRQVDALLSRFRINTKRLPKLSFSCAGLPDNFVALRDRTVLKQNYQTAQSLLKASSSRLHIVVDETTWSMGFAQARQFRDGRDCVLGGAWDPDPSKDWSCLEAQKQPLAELPKEHLAKTSLHFVAHRVDCTRYVFELCCLPTRTVIGSSDVMLSLLAQILDAATESCADCPPAGVAFDGATSNVRMLKFFVGLLPGAEWESLPFFNSCRIHYPKYKYWPFGHAAYKGEVLTSFHGSWHLQKRFSLQFISSVRKVRFADLWVDLTSELQEKLPVKPYVGADVQNDKHAIMRMSVPFLSRSWSGLGQTVHAVVAALLASGTSASPGFSKKQIASNAFSGFYLLLLHVVFNDSKGRDGSESMHMTTVRNATALTSCIVTACLTSLEHRCIQEKAVEEHFSRIKSPYRGHPSVKDGQLGILATHAKQAKKLEQETSESLGASKTCQSREALTEAEMIKLAQASLTSSIQYFCMLCTDETPDELVWKLMKWWRDHGPAFFKTTLQEHKPNPKPIIAHHLNHSKPL